MLSRCDAKMGCDARFLGGISRHRRTKIPTSKFSEDSSLVVLHTVAPSLRKHVMAETSDVLDVYIAGPPDDVRLHQLPHEVSAVAAGNAEVLKHYIVPAVQCP